jgi:hypothetical protein
MYSTIVVMLVVELVERYDIRCVPVDDNITFIQNSKFAKHAVSR